MYTPCSHRGRVTLFSYIIYLQNLLRVLCRVWEFAGALDAISGSMHKHRGSCHPVWRLISRVCTEPIEGEGGTVKYG
jgi:hypothetical protein